MTDETSAVEATEQPTTDDDALFDAGFSGDESVDVPTEETPPEQQTEAEQTPPPKYVQITEEQLNNLLNTATEIDKIKAQQDKGLSTAFGKIGGIERTLNQLKEARTATGEIALTDEEINNLEFPEVARELIPFIQSKIKVSAPEQTNFDPAQIESLAGQIAERKSVEESMEALDDEYGGQWRQIVGLPDKDGNIPETDYRKWLGTQPEEYRVRVSKTSNGMIISRSIKLFQKAQQEAKAKAQRSQRFTDAVTPKGTGEHAPAPSADDDFEAGFASG